MGQVAAGVGRARPGPVPPSGGTQRAAWNCGGRRHATCLCQVHQLSLSLPLPLALDPGRRCRLTALPLAPLAARQRDRGLRGARAAVLLGRVCSRQAQQLNTARHNMPEPRPPISALGRPHTTHTHTHTPPSSPGKRCRMARCSGTSRFSTPRSSSVAAVSYRSSTSAHWSSTKLVCVLKPDTCRFSPLPVVRLGAMKNCRGAWARARGGRPRDSSRRPRAQQHERTSGHPLPSPVQQRSAPSCPLAAAPPTRSCLPGRRTAGWARRRPCTSRGGPPP